MTWLYLDPGLGGLLLQGLAAGIVTVWVFFRKNISAFFSKLVRRKK